MPIEIMAAEARQFHRTTFTAWSIADGFDRGVRMPLSARSMREAEDEISGLYSNKETVLVLEVDAIAGIQTLHTYRVRIGRATYRRLGSTAARVTPKTAERICSLRINAFEPVEPWRWTPGCDVVGRGDNVVDVSIKVARSEFAS